MLETSVVLVALVLVLGLTRLVFDAVLYVVVPALQWVAPAVGAAIEAGLDGAEFVVTFVLFGPWWQTVVSVIGLVVAFTVLMWTIEQCEIR